MTLLDHALEYASRGWAVFPVHSMHNGKCSCGKAECEHPAKHPRTEHGLSDATTDSKQIKIWWERWPDANIGFAPSADVVIVDVDIKHHEGKYGDESLAELTNSYGDLPETVMALTGGGGLHYFFTTGGAVKNATDLLPSIDVRTKGGYVILPPSIHESGQQYEWEAAHDPTDTTLEPLPDFLYKIMTAKKQRTTRELPAQIDEGNRNDTLFKLACSLRAKGLTEPEILAAISRANQDRCTSPLSDREVTSLVHSAAKYERGGTSPHQTIDSVRPTDFTDTGNARAFAKECGTRAIYVKSVGWLAWDDTAWADNELAVTGMAMNLTDRMLQEANGEVKAAGDALTASTVAEDTNAVKEAKEKVKFAEAYRKHAKNSRNQPKIAAMVKLARTPLQVKPEKLDANPYILNTPAGMVDLKTGAILPHDPLAYCSKITKCSPGNRGSEMWRAFLDTISNGDTKMIDFLQQIAGMAAVGKAFSENLIIALGGGANGKSTFFNVDAEVMGDYAGTIAAEILTTEHRNRGAELATLRGKRLIIAAELEEGKRLSTSMLKQLTSTDKIHGERKYKDPEDFTPSHTTVLYTNHAPRVGSLDDGTWRRLITIPFNVQIPDEKKVTNYADKLVTEAGEAIMAWIVEGAKKYIAAGHKLTIPDFVYNAIEKYREESDWMSHFLDECCIIDPKQTITGGALYSTYKDWASNNEPYARRNNDFAAELEKRGFHKRKSHGTPKWFGLTVRPFFPASSPCFG